MSAIRVIESSGSLGTLQISDGSGNFLSGSLVAGSNITIGNNGSGQFTINASGDGSTIGDPPDGSWTDGLFTDFTASTQTRVPIDRFNEILKLLVPLPAEELDHIETSQTGDVAVLSFGASNDQSSAGYFTVASSAGFAAAVDKNGNYVNNGEVSNNYRIGVFKKDTDIIGDLNADASANTTTPSNRTNYPAKAFRDGDSGNLILEVNGADLRTVDLSSFGSGNSVNGNGSGFIGLIAATAGTFDNGTTFDSFKHRTGQFKVTAADQRLGWNYARVKHGSVTTNYIEWVNDNNNNDLSASSISLGFTGTGNKNLSGVKYFTGGSLTYQSTVANAYRFVYDTTATTLTPSYSGLRSPNSPTYSPGPVEKDQIGGGEDHLKNIVFNETDPISANYILGGGVTVTPNVSHPLKTNLQAAGAATASSILIYNVSDSSSPQQETFQSEAYRLQDNNYANQSDVTGGSLDWDPAVSLKHGSDTGHNTGLQVFKEGLYAPANTLNSGDFSSLANGPGSNVDYSSGITGNRTYYRKFQNNQSAKRDFSYTISGTGDLVNNASALNGDKFKLYFKLPDDSGNTTGWLDAATAFSYNNVSDNSGGAIGTINTDPAGGVTNKISFGTVPINNTKYIVAKIVAASNWTGNIDSLQIAFGAVGTVTTSPDVEDIDVDTGTSYAGKLSFGASKPAGYTVVGAAAGNSALNTNDTYPKSGNRYGIYGGAKSAKSGDINQAQTNSSAVNSKNFPNKAFGSGQANVGELKLYINGALKKTTNLASHGSGADLTAGTGFTLSAATAGEDSNDLPDYTKIYRTGTWHVSAADQVDGWNYAQVIHVIDGSTSHASTFAEWVNDVDTNNPSFSGTATTMFADANGYEHISGVKYFKSNSSTVLGTIDTTVSNLYKFVYSDSNSAISFGSGTNAVCTKIVQAGSGLTSTKTTNSSTAALQTLTTNANSQNTQTDVTATIRYNGGRSLPNHPVGSVASGKNCGGTLTFLHPWKNSSAWTATVSTTNMLVWDGSGATSNLNTVERFKDEANRIPANSDATQTTTNDASWSSSTSIHHSSSTDYADGLLVYYKALVSPKLVGASGNFKNHKESGSLESPTGNVDYSNINAGLRTYYRRFKSNDSADRPEIAVVLKGDAILKGKSGANSGTPGANKFIHCEVKLPGKTGFLDLAKAADGTITDGGGGLSGTLDATVDNSGATNICTFSGQGVSGTGNAVSDYIVVRITAHTSWTGRLSEIAITWSP